MKRLFIFGISLLLAVSFISCGKDASLDDCGCFLSIKDAQNDAQEKDQNILVVITSDGDDYCSEDFINGVLKTRDFKKNIASKYSVFHFDFSQKSYEKTVVPEKASKAKKDEAEAFATYMQNGYQFACLLDCQYTPAVYLLTKDKYVVTEVEYDDEILDVAALEEKLNGYAPLCVAMNEKVLATQTGTDLEKVIAIDKLYEETPESYRPLLLDLARKVPQLDKNNESGLISRYIVLAAQAEAIAIYSTGDLVAAVQCYIDAANNKHTKPEEVQESYYMAAYLLASSGSDDFNLISGYLALSLNACPNSEKSENIKAALDYYTELAAAAANPDAENAQ